MAQKAALRDFEAGVVVHYLAERMYFVVVDLSSQSPAAFVVSTSLEALTCEHVDFSKARIFRDLEDIKFEWDETPEDKLARTIWVGYRVCHAVSQYGIQELRKSALSVAQELRENPIPKERLALWFKKKMKPATGINFSRFIVPYLTGEKVVTFAK